MNSQAEQLKEMVNFFKIDNVQNRSSVYSQPNKKPAIQKPAIKKEKPKIDILKEDGFEAY